LKLDWARSDEGKKYFTELVRSNQAICLIAEVDEKPVGYIAAAPKEVAYRNSSYIEIENMGVSPLFRSLGTGSRLMEECLAEAKKRGFQKVYVNSYSQNESAIEFYKRNGFAVIDVSLEKML
jgi:putative acetyltransferase